MNNVKVSIITVCYNAEKTIKKTIESVLNQTYKNIEYIIVDGKSTDNTLKIINEYQSSFKGRLHVISEKDNGIYDAMNKGIKMATGELVGIINSDDYYELDAVENMVNNMSNNKYQVLYGFLNYITDEKVIKTAMLRHENLLNEMIAHPTCFVTKKVYDDLEIFDTKYKSCADYDFMIKLFNNNLVEFIPVNRVIANFTTGGMSSKLDSYIECLKMKKEHNLISNKNYIKKRIKFGIKKIFRI